MIRHDTRRVSLFVRIVAGLFVSLVAVVAPVTRAATVVCGATIVEDLTLDQDLTCATGGLIVGADGIKINLQGHSITGAGTGAGLMVVGRTDVSIFGGTIRSFLTGVLINNSAEVVVKDNILANNVDGVDVQAGSSGITIKANELLSNTARGIMLRGATTDLEIKDNTFTGNRVGILLFGPTNATVKDNNISSSLLAGMRVNFPATGNLVLANTISANPAGIEFTAGPAGGATGNALVGNTISMNTCGLKGPYAANSFKDNLFSLNTSDSCS